MHISHCESIFTHFPTAFNVPVIEDHYTEAFTITVHVHGEWQDYQVESDVETSNPQSARWVNLKVWKTKGGGGGGQALIVTKWSNGYYLGVITDSRLPAFLIIM